MPSEKQIEAVRDWLDGGCSSWGIPEQSIRSLLTAAEQAQEAKPVVKVKELEWESVDGGNAFRAPALIFGWIRIETYTLHSWQVQWSVPGICNLLMPNVFDCPSAAKAAAQADFEQRILAALETAEQAQEAQPVPIGQHVAYFDDGQFYWMSGVSPRNCELYTSPTIPEGWQLVPIEPTIEMVAAFWRQKNRGTQDIVNYGEKLSDYDAYRAMLAAAPKPEGNK